MHSDSLYQITIDIFTETESYLLGTSVRFRFVRWLCQHLLSPVNMVIFGASDLMKPLKKWAVISTAFLMLGMLSFNLIPLPAFSQTILAIVSYIPIILVMFAAPSTYVFESIAPKQVLGVSQIIIKKVNHGENLELLKENLTLIEERCLKRVKGLKWLIAGFWAIGLFLLNQLNSYSSKSEAIDISKALQQNFEALLMMALISALCLFITTSYHRAIETVFNCLKLALVEIKLSLIQTKNKP
jgi:hypothetical protein